MNTCHFDPMRRWLPGFALSLFPLCTWAAPAGWEAVEPAALAGMRGGFTLAQGLHLSIGIEQLVALNGVTVARSELVHIQGADAQHTAPLLAPSAMAGMLLVQDGSARILPGGLSPDMGGGVLVQNTLHHQNIGTQTIINASVNSGALLDTINFQGHLSDALARVAAAR